MDNTLFSEISLIIAIATLVGLVIHLLRQPQIIGYILTGIIVGPSLFNIVQSEDTVDVLAKFGITLLLFIIGLSLNPRVVREVGKAAIFTGVGQVLFTTIFGYGLVRLIGFDSMEAVFVAIALTFSSTIIVLKLLSDKKEQGRLYAKISIGFLLVQDIIATLALIFVSTTGTESDNIGLAELLIKGVVLAVVLLLFSTKILPHLTRVISSSTEFLFLFAIGWGFGIATLFAQIGFSLEVGALFAGVALAPMSYAQEVATRLRPLRDFFIVLFFVSLGSGLNLDSMFEVLPQGLLLSLFVLIGNPLIVLTIMGLLGYTKKTSFKAGLTVAQISEFSLIFILLGNSVGSVTDRTVSLVTVVALVTIAVSTYMIMYSEQLYVFFEKYLKLFEKRKRGQKEKLEYRYDALLLGYKNGGAEFIKVFKRMKKRYLVIDYDPSVIDHMEHANVPHIYGDVTNSELLDEINADKAKLVISTVTDHAINTLIVKHISKVNPKAVLICHADSPLEASELYSLGATYVLMPHYLGSEKIGSFISRNGFNKAEFNKFREKHISYLATHINSSD